MKAPFFVLGLHPTAKGFGWVLFEGPLAPFDWGTSHPQSDKHARCLGRLKTLLMRYRPQTVALERFDDRFSRRAPRIRNLAWDMVAAAQDHGAEVHIFSRETIAEAFGRNGIVPREDLAAAIARQVTALGRQLPRRRKPWEGEHANLVLFSAAACAITWYAQQS